MGAATASARTLPLASRPIQACMSSLTSDGRMRPKSPFAAQPPSNSMPAMIGPSHADRDGVTKRGCDRRLRFIDRPGPARWISRSGGTRAAAAALAPAGLALGRRVGSPFDADDREDDDG